MTETLFILTSRRMTKPPHKSVGGRTVGAIMGTSQNRPGERIIDVRVDHDTLSADFADGRTITVPLVCFPKLVHLISEQHTAFNLWGTSLEWRDAHEDISGS